VGTRYSRWDPATGAWSYFDAAEPSPNLNDDLPTPDLVPASRIGVPSIEAGRPIPFGATYAGDGEFAQGLVAPVDSTRLVARTGPLGGVGLSVDWRSLLLGSLLGGLIVWYYRKAA